MKLMTQEEKIATRDLILRLAVDCPVDRINPLDCPLYLIRKLELPERLKWFDALTADDLQYLSTYHCICMKFKAKLPQSRRSV
jgi:hypothetical protein